MDGKPRCKTPECSRTPSRRGYCRACWEAVKHANGWNYLSPPLNPAKESTRHEPGSEGKVRVMRERARNREEIFHPDDARGIETLSSGWD